MYAIIGKRFPQIAVKLPGTFAKGRKPLSAAITIPFFGWPRGRAGDDACGSPWFRATRRTRRRSL